MDQLNFNHEEEAINDLAAPRVSVLMSVYNGVPHLEQAVSSILDQTQDFEFVIINDGSTDATQQTLENFP